MKSDKMSLVQIKSDGGDKLDIEVNPEIMDLNKEVISQIFANKEDELIITLLSLNCISKDEISKFFGKSFQNKLDTFPKKKLNKLKKDFASFKGKPVLPITIGIKDNLRKIFVDVIMAKVEEKDKPPWGMVI